MTAGLRRRLARLGGTGRAPRAWLFVANPEHPFLYHAAGDLAGPPLTEAECLALTAPGDSVIFIQERIVTADAAEPAA